MNLKSFTTSTLLLLSLCLVSGCGGQDNVDPNPSLSNNIGNNGNNNVNNNNNIVNNGGGDHPGPTQPAPQGIIARIDVPNHRTLHLFDFQGQPLVNHQLQENTLDVKVSRTLIAYRVINDRHIYVHNNTGAQIFDVLIGDESQYQVSNHAIAYTNDQGYWVLKDTTGQNIQVEDLSRDDQSRIRELQISDGALVYQIGNTLHIRRPNGRRFPTIESISDIRPIVRREGGSGTVLTDGLLAFLKTRDTISRTNHLITVPSLNVINLQTLSQGTANQPPTHGFLSGFPQLDFANPAYSNNPSNPGSPLTNYQITNSMIVFRSTDGVHIFNAQGTEITSRFPRSMVGQNTVLMATGGSLICTTVDQSQNPPNIFIQQFNISNYTEVPLPNIHTQTGRDQISRAHNIASNISHEEFERQRLTRNIPWIVDDIEADSSLSQNIAIVTRNTNRLTTSTADGSQRVETTTDKLIYNLNNGQIIREFPNINPEDTLILSQ